MPPLTLSLKRGDIRSFRIHPKLGIDTIESVSKEVVGKGGRKWERSR